MSRRHSHFSAKIKNHPKPARYCGSVKKRKKNHVERLKTSLLAVATTLSCFAMTSNLAAQVSRGSNPSHTIFEKDRTSRQPTFTPLLRLFYPSPSLLPGIEESMRDSAIVRKKIRSTKSIKVLAKKKCRSKNKTKKGKEEKEAENCSPAYGQLRS